VSNQVRVPTLLNDSAAVDDNDAIGTLDGAQPVCDDDYSSTFQVGVYRLLNLSTVATQYTFTWCLLCQILTLIGTRG